MMFRRAGVRYSLTPAPVTPYQAAQQLWDDRIGSARVQAKNWRLMALGTLVLAFAMAGGLLWQSTHSTVTPYVVEVDTQGGVRAVGPAVEAYHPNDAQIDYHLSRFLRNVRSIPIDPIVLRENWLEAYDYATDRAAARLNEYARVRDPFANVGRTSIAIEITSVVRVSDSSFQLRWIERSYVSGTLNSTERWTAILSIVLQPPKDVARIRKNPLGVYVDGLDWSRELGGDTATGDSQ
jgi:type IV secretory pathway TrbF-like protein